MAILLANIAFEYHIPNTLSGLGKTVCSFDNVTIFADWTVVREAATRAACRAVIEDVKFIVKCYGMVVKSWLIHNEGQNFFSNDVFEFEFKGPIDLTEDIDGLVKSSID